MAPRAVTAKQSHKTAICYFCGSWPACLYKDIREKHGPRVCETCVANGTVIRDADGVYITNPEPPAAPEGVPGSGSRSSTPQTDETDSAA